MQQLQSHHISERASTAVAVKASDLPSPGAGVQQLLDAELLESTFYAYYQR